MFSDGKYAEEMRCFPGLPLLRDMDVVIISSDVIIVDQPKFSFGHFEY